MVVRRKMAKARLFGSRATELLMRRRCHGLEQHEAAKLLGFDRWRFCKWERGVLPPPDSVMRMARQRMPI